MVNLDMAIDMAEKLLDKIESHDDRVDYDGFSDEELLKSIETDAYNLAAVCDVFFPRACITEQEVMQYTTKVLRLLRVYKALVDAE